MWIEFRTIGHEKRALKEGSERPQKLIKKMRVSGELSKINQGEFRARDKFGEPRSERAIQLAAQRRSLQCFFCEVLDCAGRAGEGRKEAEATKVKVKVNEAHAVNVEVKEEIMEEATQVKVEVNEAPVVSVEVREEVMEEATKVKVKVKEEYAEIATKARTEVKCEIKDEVRDTVNDETSKVKEAANKESAAQVDKPEGTPPLTMSLATT